MRTQYRRIAAVVGVYRTADGDGIGIDISNTGLEGQPFFDMLGEMLKPAGFPNIRAIWFERNAAGGKKVSWNSLRIPNSVCQLHGVDPRQAPGPIKRWMRSSKPREMFGVTFDITEPVSAMAAS